MTTIVHCYSETNKFYAFYSQRWMTFSDKLESVWSLIKGKKMQCKPKTSWSYGDSLWLESRRGCSPPRP